MIIIITMKTIYLYDNVVNLYFFRILIVFISTRHETIINRKNYRWYSSFVEEEVFIRFYELSLVKIVDSKKLIYWIVDDV